MNFMTVCCFNCDETFANAYLYNVCTDKEPEQSVLPSKPKQESTKIINAPCLVKACFNEYGKTKSPVSCAVTTQLISDNVFFTLKIS